jgi:hypothetical protein
MGRKKKEPTPAQKARRALMEKYGLRGSRAANLWIIACPLTGEDLVFSSDAHAEHYYVCSGDPEVQAVQYRVDPVRVTHADKTLLVQFDARVELADGTIEYRRVGASAPTRDGKKADLFPAFEAAARQQGGVYRPVPLADLDRHVTRSANWRRALRWLRAARHHPLAIIESDVRLRVEQHAPLDLARLAASLPQHPFPLVIAAAVRLVFKRALRSDLDTAPWSAATLLRPAPRPATVAVAA